MSLFCVVTFSLLISSMFSVYLLLFYLVSLLFSDRYHILVYMWYTHIWFVCRRTNKYCHLFMSASILSHFMHSMLYSPKQMYRETQRKAHSSYWSENEEQEKFEFPRQWMSSSRIMEMLFGEKEEKKVVCWERPIKMNWIKKMCLAWNLIFEVIYARFPHLIRLITLDEREFRNGFSHKMSVNTWMIHTIFDKYKKTFRILSVLIAKTSCWVLDLI